MFSFTNLERVNIIEFKLATKSMNQFTGLSLVLNRKEVEKEIKKIN